jgi:hypothetical protein
LQGRPQIQQLQQHHQLQLQQLQQIPQQQPSPQQLGQRQSISPQQIGQRPGGSPQQAGGARPGTSPRRLTVEDIRARGEQLRQQQLRMIHGGGTLRTPGETNSSSGSPVGGGENRTTPPANGVGGVDIRRGNRLGALIGGGPADQRGGGPMLVIGSDDGTPQYGGWEEECGMWLAGCDEAIALFFLAVIVGHGDLAFLGGLRLLCRGFAFVKWRTVLYLVSRQQTESKVRALGEWASVIPKHNISLDSTILILGNLA